MPTILTPDQKTRPEVYEQEKRTYYPFYFAVQADAGLRMKERENMCKHIDFTRELKREKVMMISN